MNPEWIVYAVNIHTNRLRIVGAWVSKPLAEILVSLWNLGNHEAIAFNATTKEII